MSMPGVIGAGSWQRSQPSVPAPAGPALLAQWSLDEALGAATADDTQGVSDGTYSGVELEHGSLVAGDAGTSARFFGNSSVAVPHAAAMAINDYSIVVYGQIFTGPAIGQNAMLVQKDRPTLAGGWQVGVVNDGGTLRPQIFTKNAGGSAQHVGGVGTGIPGVSLPTGTAFMLVMTVGGTTGTKAYLDKLLVGSTGNAVGMAGNNEQIGIGRYRPGITDTAGFVGWIDEVRIYAGVLEQSGIDALPDAQSIATGAAVLVSEWKLDELSGTVAADSQGVSNGVYSGTTLGWDSLISGDAGKSVQFSGSSYVAVPHNAAFELAGYSVVVYGQIQTAPAAGQSAMLIQKDRPSLPGGWQLGIVNDGGTLRVAAYTKDAAGTATQHGGASGVGQLSIGTAFMLVQTVGLGGTKLYLNKQLIATSAVQEGLGSNDEQIGIGIYRPGIANTAGLQGWIDRPRIYSGVLLQEEIDALQDAQSLVTSNPFPTPTNTQFKDLGTRFATATLSDGGAAIYDCRGTTWDNTYSSGSNTYTPSFAIRFGASHNGGGAFGGTIMNGYAVSLGDTQPRNYPENHAGQIYVRDWPVTDFFFDGWRLHHNWDPFRMGFKSGVTAISNITFRRCWCSDAYDDALENDTHRDGVVFDDCLLDGFYAGFSDRNSGSTQYGSRILTIRNSLCRLRPTYPNQQHKMFFKLNGNSISFDVFDSIFRVDQPADVTGGDPFWDLNRYAKLRNSSGNIILWGGSGSYQWPIPSGFTVFATGAAAITEWNNRAAAWKAAHPFVPRIPGLD